MPVSGHRPLHACPLWPARTRIGPSARALVRRLPTKIVLLGMTPDRPEAGFGYLEPGPPLPGDAAAFRVASFVEKPTPETAAEIIRRGGLWNSFVMVFRLDRMLTLLRRRRPADCAVLRQVDEDAYPALTPWNASRDFLAHIPTALAVLQVDDVGWSDWGTPEAIARTFRDLAPPWAVAGSRASRSTPHPGAPCAGTPRRCRVRRDGHLAVR